jgi:photosystem II stability/assembly factor-like uncharacterized protein
VECSSGVTEDLHSIFFIDKMNGWAVGDFGTILHTDNGGETWKNQSTVCNTSLQGVCFPSLTSGWAVGTGGTILHTVNGGTIWQFQNSGTTESLYSVTFTDELNGWACGDNGIVLHTANGGDYWNRVPGFLNHDLRDCFFVDQQHGWVTGTRATVYRTADGGLTWTYWYDPFEFYIRSLFFIDTLNGWFCGGDYQYQTTDGGISWNRQSIIYSGSWTDICFTSKFLGMATMSGYYGGGSIQKTTDGGFTWSEYFNGGFDPKSICFADYQNGWVACSATHYLYRTTDAGYHWEQVFVAGNHAVSNLKSIFFVDVNNGWAVGENGNILKWEDTQPQGIDERGPELEVTVYPNPTRGIFDLQFTVCNLQSVGVEIVDLFGKVVREEETRRQGEGEMSFDLSDLPVGVYFVRICVDKHMNIKKIIKL